MNKNFVCPKKELRESLENFSKEDSLLEFEDRVVMDEEKVEIETSYQSIVEVKERLIGLYSSLLSDKNKKD
ncbi:MAG TPA: hypothetical protein P5048_03510 [Chlamydiales bacterium]|nr:hypothetical protein [Chlamydiales bacterium]